MAKIISESMDKEVDVEDGSEMKVIEEAFDVPFACKDGNCGTCQIEVTEGIENLTTKTEKEIEFGMEDTTRFACQCQIKQGNVKIKHY